jgi:membrane protein DedA with SNARE-associated domain
LDISLSTLTEHGYAILFAVVFLEAIGLALPAALARLLAGGAAALGSLNVWYALGGSLAAMVAGDTLMFVLGRYTGWWLLGLLCRMLALLRSRSLTALRTYQNPTHAPTSSLISIRSTRL